MKSESQNNQDFRTLRRLLALKRYEQPPPGYFDEFASQVIRRIEAGEGAHESALQRLLWGATWLQRLWTALETKPIMAGAFGGTVLALLVGAVIYPERPECQTVIFGPETSTVNGIEFAKYKPSDQLAFDTFIRVSDPTAIPRLPFLSPFVEGFPKPTTPLFRFSLPGAN